MTMTFNRSVAGEVRAEMARQRLGVGELADRLGWNRQYLSRRINDAQPFSTDDLESLSKVLNIPLSALTSPRAAGA